MSLTSIFQDIADAIRSKTGKADSIYPSDMASEIESIKGGGKAQNAKVTAGTTNKLTLSISVYESEV